MRRRRGQAFSSDGKLLAVSTQAGWSLWSLADGSHLFAQPQPAYALAFSPDNRLLAVGDIAGGIHSAASTSSGA